MTDLHRLAELIDDALPQTQCTQCGYDGCAPYARAIAFKGESINQCPPSGQTGIAELARLTGRPVIPLNPKNGIEQPRRLAKIIEEQCIGCTKCIQACPVDAIIGTSKFMHVVLSDLCTGCALCVPPCPVDCIEMPVADSPPWSHKNAQEARSRFELRNARLIREKNELNEKRIHRATARLEQLNRSGESEADRKRAIITAALARARARREQQ